MGNNQTISEAYEASEGDKYLLSGDCSSPDVFSIKDDNSGNVFKVKNPGIRFKLLAVYIDPDENDRNKRMAHYGLLCDDNTFVLPNGNSYTMCLAHRIKSNVQLVFSNNEEDFV